MSEPVSVTLEDRGGQGAFRAVVEGMAEQGELTWRETAPGVIVADHTLVPKAIGGRGVAGLLVDALIGEARARGWKIVPACSYVEAQFRRHPEWSDLLAQTA